MRPHLYLVSDLAWYTVYLMAQPVGNRGEYVVTR